MLSQRRPNEFIAIVSLKQDMGLCASKSDQQASAKPNTATTARTKATTKHANQHATKPVNKAERKPLRTGGGQKINDDDENKSKLSPQEAARLAAEKRLEDNHAKSTRGALGKKLAEERSKSHKSHMMEQIDKRQLEKANDELVYD